LTLTERTANNTGRVIDYPRSSAVANISICVAATTSNLSEQQAGTEQTTRSLGVWASRNTVESTQDSGESQEYARLS
ncbi:hypothetical protein LTR48_009461, partial [Friedmanniomyces endolithicus]